MNKETFKKLLKASDLNQSEFCNLTDLNKDTVSGWNAGRYPFPAWVDGWLKGYIARKQLIEIKDKIKIIE